MTARASTTATSIPGECRDCVHWQATEPTERVGWRICSRLGAREGRIHETGRCWEWQPRRQQEGRAHG